MVSADPPWVGREARSDSHNQGESDAVQVRDLLAVEGIIERDRYGGKSQRASRRLQASTCDVVVARQGAVSLPESDRSATNSFATTYILSRIMAHTVFVLQDRRNTV